jgi:septal ring factor EnvC (AmiA/AmiB activator)
MSFLTLDQTTKKWLLAFLACLFSWWLLSSSATCSASPTQEKTYTITETQLQTLEVKLNLLDQILAQQNPELTTLQLRLAESRNELSTLRSELNTSKERLMKAEESLVNANQLLAKYAEETKRERLRIKAQRNTWLAVALVAATVAIVK